MGMDKHMLQKEVVVKNKSSRANTVHTDPTGAITHLLESSALEDIVGVHLHTEALIQKQCSVHC